MIKYTDIFDFSDASEVNKAIKLINSLIDAMEQIKAMDKISLEGLIDQTKKLSVSTAESKKQAEDTTNQIKIYEKRILSLERALKELNQEKDKEKAKAKEAKVATAEEIEAKVRLQIQNQKLRNEIKQKILATEAEAGSINALRLELGEVTRAWAALSEEQRENTEAGKRVTAQKLELTEKLKSLEKATGDHRREVGNYSLALTNAGEITSVLSQNTGILGQLIEQASGKIEQINEKLNGMQEAAAANGKDISKMVGLLRGLGVVGVVVGAAVAGLAYAFGRTEQGAKAFNRIQAQTSAVLDVLVSKASKAALGIADFASGLQESSEKSTFFGKALGFMKDRIVQSNPALLAVEYATRGLRKELSAAADQAAAVADRMFELQKAEIAMIPVNKQLLRDAEKMRLVRDSELKSIEERMAANDAVLRIEKEREAVQTSFLQTRLAILQADKDATPVENYGKRLEIERQIMETQEEIFDLQEDSAGKQTEAITNNFSLRKELAERETSIREQEYRKLLREASGNEAEILRLQIERVRELSRIEMQVAGEDAERKREIQLRLENDIADLRKAYFEAEKERLAELATVAESINGTLQRTEAEALEESLQKRIESLKATEQQIVLNDEVSASEQRRLAIQLQLEKSQEAQRKFAKEYPASLGAINDVLRENIKNDYAKAILQAYISSLQAGKSPQEARMAVVDAVAALGIANVLSREKGGIVPGGEQFIRVNERGPEFVIDHATTQALGLNRPSAGMGDFHRAINTQIDYERLAREIGKAVSFEVSWGVLDGHLARTTKQGKQKVKTVIKSPDRISPF